MARTGLTFEELPAPRLKMPDSLSPHHSSLQWDRDETSGFRSQTPVEDYDSAGERCVWLESTALWSREWRRCPCLWEQQGGVVWLPAQPGKIKYPLPHSPWVGKARSGALAQLGIQGQGGETQ